MARNASKPAQGALFHMAPNVRRLRLSVIAALLPALLLGACVNSSYPIGPEGARGAAPRVLGWASGASAPSGAPGLAARPRNYYLQPGDTFDVKFFYSTDLNESVVVRPDGKISLQLIGEVQAAGMKPSELEQDLLARYGKVLKNPSVTVIVRQFTPQRVFVAGQVGAPGEVPLQGDMTALQAISRAGFFTRDAEARSVVILRYKGDNGPEFITIDLKALLNGKTEDNRGSAFDSVAANDVVLEPFDVVFVPESRIASVADFFGRYVNNIVPLWRNLGFNMNYYTNSLKTRTVVPVP